MTTISTVTPFSVAAPTRADPTTFSSRGDTIMTEMVAMVPDINTTVGEMNTVAGEVNANAAAASDSATAAASSASAAAVTANAAAWVAGNYALNANAISGLDGQTYRNYVSAGDRLTDPKNDPTNWVRLGAPAELWTKGADIASAATINLTTATGDYVHVTGTTTITAITIPVGAERTVIFDGILTLTHSAALLLPGAANITAAANDRMTVRGDTAGAIVISYTRADGTPVKSGMVLLATITPTAAANVDFLNVFSATYDNYLITGSGIKPAADDGLFMVFATGGAADTGSNYFRKISETATEVTVASTSMVIAATTTSAGKGVDFVLNINNVNDATNIKLMAGKCGWQQSATPGYNMGGAHGVYTAANAISGFRLFWQAAANFSATGVVRVYGYANT